MGCPIGRTSSNPGQATDCPGPPAACQIPLPCGVTREEPAGTHDSACRLGALNSCFQRLFNPDRITATDQAAALDCRIDADIDVVMLRGGAQDAGIWWQVPLGQGRHDTA